jgi:hypothetical protein
MSIYRDGYGHVGAICINVDYHYLDQEVRSSQKRLNDFSDSFLRTDVVLDENILSKNEYEKALEGKTHFRDALILSSLNIFMIVIEEFAWI